MLRVLVAEDSATARRLIVMILSADPDITVVGQAVNGQEAVELCTQLRPDVVTMDIQMPVLDGIEATRQIMQTVPTPVVMVSSLNPADIKRSMTAFDTGALAVMAKPSGPGAPRFEQDSRELVATVKALAGARAATTEGPAPAVAAPRDAKAAKVAVVGIVASTGGPIALRTLFKALPVTCKPPILIVQHIASGFAQGFADWLRETTRRTVKIAVDGDPLAPGVVYVAPDDHHLSVQSDRVVVSATPAVDGARPSGTVLLTSLADQFGKRAAGVILTGTGVDGVEGLRRVRDAGGPVFAQDEATCTTFGTSRAAITAKIVEDATPLGEIPRRIAELV